MMAATNTTTIGGTRSWQRRVPHVLGRMAAHTGALLLGIASRWDTFVDSGQLGPSPHRDISRHTGGRI